jgi:hypothetical protein
MDSPTTRVTRTAVVANSLSPLGLTKLFDGPFQRRFLVAMLVAFVAYTLVYLAYPALPGNWPEYPRGWWGWFDQGQYLQSAQAFSHGLFEGRLHQYPPLWPLLGTVFVKFLPMHPFFIPGFLCLAVHLLGVLRIGEYLYGRVLTWVTVAFVFVLWRDVTTTQWIIPWTSSLSGAISSVLFLTYFRFDHKNEPWVLVSVRDWLCVSAFFLSYGALFATRPVDVFSFFPIALLFFLRCLRGNCWPLNNVNAIRRIGALSGVIMCGGLIFPIAYLAFNVVAFGQAFGGYFTSALRNGYYLGIIPEQLVSLFTDSVGLSLEPSATIGSHYPIFIPAFAVCVVAVGSRRGIIQVVALTIVAHFLVYLPYADLTPKNLYRFYLIHYFKWTFPWLTLIFFGEAARCFGRNAERKILWTPIIASAIVAMVLANLRIVFPRFDAIVDSRSQEERHVVIESQLQRTWSVIDLLGIHGGFNEIVMNEHVVKLDGRRLTWLSEFRIFPTDWGTRLVLIRPLTGKKLEVTFMQPVTIDKAASVSLVGNYSIALTCAVRTCSSITHFSDLPDPLIFDMEAGGNGNHFAGNNWSNADAAGTWTTAKRAAIFFVAPVSQDIAVSATVAPLLSPSAPEQTARIAVNDCRIGEATFGWNENHGPKTISGSAPARCVGADGAVQLTIETDRVSKPKDIGLGTDGRTLGVQVKSIEVRH